MSECKLQPVNERVVIKVAESSDYTKGGIVLPDTAKEKPQEGKVMAVGPGKLLKDGKISPLEVKKGDYVIYPRYAGTQVKVQGEEYLIVLGSDILAIVERD